MPTTSFLSTTRGKVTLALLCAVAFIDFVDASIVNIALPSIRRALHFSEQDLQWVPSGYLLTYGGLMLLGGRAADLIGRRRVLISGTVLIGVSSLIGGLAGSAGVLIGARLVQGLGAAMMLPAALSILTTTFREGAERNTALGVWGGVGGLASAAGGMLLLVYALVQAPTVGWGTARTIAEITGGLLLLAAFVANELRHRNPLVPLSIFKINGLGFADATQLVAFALTDRRPAAGEPGAPPGAGSAEGPRRRPRPAARDRRRVPGGGPRRRLRGPVGGARSRRCPTRRRGCSSPLPGGPRGTVGGGRIVEIDVLADPERLRGIDLTVLDS